MKPFVVLEIVVTLMESFPRVNSSSPILIVAELIFFFFLGKYLKKEKKHTKKNKIQYPDLSCSASFFASTSGSELKCSLISFPFCLNCLPIIPILVSTIVSSLVMGSSNLS